MIEISAEQFASWKEHPVTQVVFEAIREERERLFSFIGSGNTVNFDSCDNTQANTSMVVGHIRGLDFLLNMSFSETKGEEDATGKD